MSDIKLCRICLRKDVKMYEHDRFQLKFYYKEVTGTKMSSRDFPTWFCFECAALLHKFHKFKSKCHYGQKIFKELLETGSTNMDKITRHSHIQILSASRNKSVRTYTFKHSYLTQNNKKIHINKKKRIFTEVFVNDLKSEVDNLKLKMIKEISQKTTDIENITTPSDNDFVFDNGAYNGDSNDSLPLNNSKVESDVETKLNNVEQKINHSEEGNETLKNINDIEEQNAKYISPAIEQINTAIKPTSIKKQTPVLSQLKFDEPNLDHKFQRSVKKKFLDENHWTKITLSDEEATRRFQSKALEQKYIQADFKCTDCYRTFSQEDMMKRHIKLRHCESLGPNECRHCRMRFKWKSRLQKHLKEHYTIYKCLRCELSFPVEISAFQHDYSHNGVTWTCAHCGQGFRHSSTYYTHLRKHKSKYVCTLCGVSFVSEFGLFMHKRVKHVINDDSIEECSDTYCKICDMRFDTLKGYNDHFAESALHATEVVEGATSLPLKTKCTRRRVPRISTTCAVCGKIFSTYAAFTKHHLSVHPDLPVPKSRTDRQDGQRQICEVCGITLASAWSLINHLHTHNRDKRYTCKTCGLQLTSRSILQRHQQTHSHEKKFSCELCEKSFVHRSGLRLHGRTHNKDHSPSVRNRRKKTETQNMMEYFKSYGPLANNFR